MKYSFIWFLNYIKICNLYLKKSRLVGEHCKAYKFKSEVFTKHACWMYLRTKEGIFVKTLASHHCGWVISRTLLFMSAEFVVDPRIFSRRFSLGSPFFLLIKLTFRIPITMWRTISWVMWNFCALILVCFLVAFTGWNKVFRRLGLQTRKHSPRKRTQYEKTAKFLELLSRNSIN